MMVPIEKLFGHFLDYVVVCIVPCRRHKRRERAGTERLRGAVGDPETGWYTVKSFLDTFSRKSITMEGQKMENSHPEKAK
ncbi:hypothetical protein [Faecalibacterium sp. An122]|uniref:hypothetical protein n=1 Tax=Faecalibacterium sp. An122 TaxID=1965551 RepID=UPI00117AED2F|nr:hypothetical protein [Faecalibacterium sp. An122]